MYNKVGLIILWIFLF